MEPKLLSIKQSATYLGVAVWFIRTSIWEGKLPARRLGKKLMISPADLDRLVEQTEFVR